MLFVSQTKPIKILSITYSAFTLFQRSIWNEYEEIIILSHLIWLHNYNLTHGTIVYWYFRK